MTNGKITKQQLHTWLEERFTYFMDIEFIENSALMYFLDKLLELNLKLT